jgi:hypothetical protein
MLANLFKLDGNPAVHQQGDPMPSMSPGDSVLNTHFRGRRWYQARKAVKGVTFSNVSMSGLVLSKITFTDCTFEDCIFTGTQFIEVEFHNCFFVNCTLWKPRFQGCYLRPESIRFAKRYRVEAANVGVTLYHSLLANYAEERQGAFFQTADIEFRRWKRFQLAHDIRHNHISALSGNWQRFTSWIYDFLAGYGYKPVRFFVFTVVVFGLISLLNYYAIGDALLVNGSRVHDVSLVDSAFYSFSVLTILGFSTIVPDGAGAKLLTVFEALAAVGWLAIFTSVLVKRFLR